MLLRCWTHRYDLQARILAGKLQQANEQQSHKVVNYDAVSVLPVFPAYTLTIVTGLIYILAVFTKD